MLYKEAGEYFPEVSFQRFHVGLLWISLCGVVANFPQRVQAYAGHRTQMATGVLVSGFEGETQILLNEVALGHVLGD